MLGDIAKLKYGGMEEVPLSTKYEQALFCPFAVCNWNRNGRNIFLSLILIAANKT